MKTHIQKAEAPDEIRVRKNLKTKENIHDLGLKVRTQKSVKKG